MRGENFCDSAVGMICCGTPPHAWGKRPKASRSVSPNRYTPTCVGKTDIRVYSLRDADWYTPTCVGKTVSGMKKPPPTRYTPTCVGKTAELKRRGLEAVGTPPHAWGKHCGKQITRISHRYTPTCVGKTPFIVETASSYAVHPHMRGENGANGQARAVLVGTPPHAWGKLPTLLNFLTCSRYTPTCVGKTSRSTTVFRHSAVHPHMRGENTA